MYDCIVIGAGPAGLTAGTYASRNKLKTLILAKELGMFEAGLNSTEPLPGYLETKFKQEVVSLEKNYTSFQVETKSGESFFARSIIIASGQSKTSLGIPNEEKYLGNSLLDCSYIEPIEYKDKTVAVIGSNALALEALLNLSKFSNKIYSININSELIGNKILKQKVESLASIIFFNKTKVTEFKGTKNLETISIHKNSGEIQSLKVDAVFFETETVGSTDFEVLTAKNETAHIKVNANMETNVKGVFAAGDCTTVKYQQSISIIGDAIKAATSVVHYLNVDV